MKSFLRRIANRYIANEADDIGRVCFVFPNKRSATFFREAVELESDGRIRNIRTKTINSFVAGFSRAREAERLEALFVMFREYRRILEEQTTSSADDALDFDRFAFWGDMLINDFNDVDRYLADPDKIFVNAKRFKEINSNYLTPEQVEAIKRYWGEDRSQMSVENFWTHVDSRGRSTVHTKFLRLWEVMALLYHRYRDALRSRRLTTSGAIFREAADAIRKGDSLRRMPYRRYVFIGFNLLSTSEHIIFSRLRDKGMADFYWDCDSPILLSTDNPAGRFIRANMAEFPSLYQIDGDTKPTSPMIDIVGVPGNMAQIYAASQTLADWISGGKIADPANAIDTAVVLPDESLFVPLVHNMPEEITDINVTMGFPFRQSPVSTLLRLISSLQMHSREGRNGPTFFHEDVSNLLVDPNVRRVAPDEADALADEILSSRLFRVEERLIQNNYPSLAPIFTAVRLTDSTDRICDYLRQMATLLLDSTAEQGVARHFLDAYIAKIDEIQATIQHHGIEMRGATLVRMIERSLQSEIVHFKGEPLAGLQVMGVLETRALDFDNIIVMSMNERIFPRRNHANSFIPESIRRGYGLPTSDFQESVYAYYFYRLISRASRVTLTYDVRTSGLRTGELSRYAVQLLYLSSGATVTHRQLKFNNGRNERHAIAVNKTASIMKKLMRFTSKASKGNELNLSASNINTYLSCPLEFYLRYVEGFDPSDELHDYIDASTNGTIVHDTAEAFYNMLKGDASEVTVTADMLQHHIDHPEAALEKIITRVINKNFLRLGDNCLNPLKGEALIAGKLVESLILTMLRREKDLTPFRFISAEEPVLAHIDAGLPFTLRLKQRIDRIDRVAGRLRIVDYKTGGDSTTIDADLDRLFARGYCDVKAVRQLIIYCMVYAAQHDPEEPIQPLIYKFRDMALGGIQPLRIKADRYRLEDLTDYHQVIDGFRERLNEVLREIFDPSVPFSATDDEKSCTFCHFKAICGRNGKTD